MLGNGEGDGKKGKQKEQGERDKVKKREGKIATRKGGEEAKQIKERREGMTPGKEKDEREKKREDENRAMGR